MSGIVYFCNCCCTCTGNNVICLILFKVDIKNVFSLICRLDNKGKCALFGKLISISRKVKLYVTRGNRIFANGYCLRKVIFDVVIGRESSEYTKESGEPTKLALKLLDANPKTTLMIGDAPMDYISAKNAGIENIILVATGQIGINKLNNTCNNTCNSLNIIRMSFH